MRWPQRLYGSSRWRNSRSSRDWLAPGMLPRRRSLCQARAYEPSFVSSHHHEPAVHELDKRHLRFITVLLIVAFIVAVVATYVSLVLFPATP